MLLITGRDSYNPRIHGRLSELPSGQGTELKLTAAIHPVVIFLVLCFFFFPAVSIARSHEPFGLIFLSVPCALHVGLVFAGFRPGAKRAEALIRPITE